VTFELVQIQYLIAKFQEYQQV